MDEQDLKVQFRYFVGAGGSVSYKGVSRNEEESGFISNKVTMNFLRLNSQMQEQEQFKQSFRRSMAKRRLMNAVR